MRIGSVLRCIGGSTPGDSEVLRRTVRRTSNSEARSDDLQLVLTPPSWLPWHARLLRRPAPSVAVHRHRKKRRRGARAKQECVTRFDSSGRMNRDQARHAGRHNVQSDVLGGAPFSELSLQTSRQGFATHPEPNWPRRCSQCSPPSPPGSRLHPPLRSFKFFRDELLRELPSPADGVHCGIDPRNLRQSRY